MLGSFDFVLYQGAGRGIYNAHAVVPEVLAIKTHRWSSAVTEGHADDSPSPWQPLVSSSRTVPPRWLGGSPSAPGPQRGRVAGGTTSRHDSGDAPPCRGTSAGHVAHPRYRLGTRLRHPGNRVSVLEYHCATDPATGGRTGAGEVGQVKSTPPTAHRRPRRTSNFVRSEPWSALASPQAGVPMVTSSSRDWKTVTFFDRRFGRRTGSEDLVQQESAPLSAGRPRDCRHGAAGGRRRRQALGGHVAI